MGPPKLSSWISLRSYARDPGIAAARGRRERCVYDGAMKTSSAQGGRSDGCCVVLMMKSPARSKRRLAELIGAQRATEAAQRLLDCAYEDLAAWAGPKCVAPSADDERAEAPSADAVVVVQRGGNLGERINHVNNVLIGLGFERQLFIGIDCPSLDRPYLDRAAAALDDQDTVLGPADDGGVVLMGVRGRWPALAALPWSTSGLFESLRAACAAAGSSVAMLPRRHDIDTANDLITLRDELHADPRPARRALVRWIGAQRDLRT
jgi:glycosyltransferase A (GT-A) superfamily protein (DUF2064 family)